MNTNEISDLLDLSSSDSFDDDYSSDEYVQHDSDNNNSDEIIEDSDTDVEITDNDWNSDINTIPKLFDFTGNSGLQCTLSSNNPYDYFSLFFDDSIMNNIVTWVNLKANILRSQGVKKRSNLSSWKNIDICELKKFIGLSLLMGIHKLPTIRLYWSQSEIDYHPIYGQTLSRNRYETILRCLCFYDPFTTDKSDRLHKINNVLGPIISNIQTKYYPKECLSLDESMLLWRGRLSFRQYIPSKAHKYGIKFFELCTDDGFILDLIIYKGKGTVTDSRGVTFGIVDKLMKNYLGKGHTLYMDNYYNSVQLAEYLYKNKTHVVGTLRKNRKENPSITSAKLKKGEAVHAQKNNVHVTKWVDKREVCMISTKHNLGFENVIDKFGRQKFKPTVIVDYNNHMSGIDRADQMMSYYPMPRKCMRWYIKVFFHLVDICLWNSNYLYNLQVSKTSHLEFRRQIISSLLGVPLNKRPSCSPKSLTINETQSKPVHNIKKVQKRKRCRVCHANKKRSTTLFICDTCKDEKENTIGLCADPCFKIFHTK